MHPIDRCGDYHMINFDMRRRIVFTLNPTKPGTARVKESVQYAAKIATLFFM